ncbi:MAG: hypothetical protein KA104_00435 [Candidatus Pacebacteria bacterium]|nr:hypothetical protein [Candidatus Paceibacterota bacterium]
MDTETKLAELSQKLDAVYISVEKTRKYLLWTLIGTVVAFVLPLLAALFIVPTFMAQYSTTINALIQ